MDLKLWLFLACMDLIDDLGMRIIPPAFGARLRSHEDYSTLSPVIAAAETFHEGGPSHPAFSESSVPTGGKAPSDSERGSIVLRGGSGQRTSVRNVACCGVLH